MEQINITSTEAILYIVLINIGLGLLLGLIPLIAGFVKNNRKFGLFGLFGSIIGGAVLGVVLSLPVAAVFTWLIFKNSNSAQI